MLTNIILSCPSVIYRREGFTYINLQMHVCHVCSNHDLLLLWVFLAWWTKFFITLYLPIFSTFLPLQSREYIKHRIWLHNQEFESSSNIYLPVVTLGSYFTWLLCASVSSKLVCLQTPFVILFYFLLPWNLVVCAIHLKLSVSFF